MALSDSCWIWDGPRHGAGYGVTPKGELAHRVIYELMVGPIPGVQELDHICRQRGCVNPSHLRPVSRRENLLAPGSRSQAAVNASKTHCSKGHPFDTRWLDGSRRCRECRNEGKRNAYRSKRESQGLTLRPWGPGRPRSVVEA
jgi:hypothetical protein